jgi:hypothetical protein
MKNPMHKVRLIQITAVVLSLCATSLLAADATNKIPDSARVALEKAEQFELLSLDPERHQNRWPKYEFHGWRILGSMMIKDAEARNDLVTALKKSVEENNNMVARCFNPRHGIRVIYDGKTNDLVICFQCLQVLVYQCDDDEKPEDFLIRDSSQSAQSLFNRVLMKQKIPLAGR